jgi:molybdopterin synthase sulfur carrier subunit
MKVRVRYFASLRDAAGVESEELNWKGRTLAELYAELAARHAFSLPPERLRVALDGQIVAWDTVPGTGCEVVFIPPVSGG